MYPHQLGRSAVRVRVSHGQADLVSGKGRVRAQPRDDTYLYLVGSSIPLH